MKTKLLIPVILATVMMIGATFAVTPVQKASTVHTTILAAIAGANNPANRAGNTTAKETLRGEYIWSVIPGVAANSNGTLLVNFAGATTVTGTPVSKVTGQLVVTQNGTASWGTNARTNAVGTGSVYSGNATTIVKVSTLDLTKSTFVTLGGNGLDLRANSSATNALNVFFTVVKVD